jgi:hypothetical protein
MMKVKVARPPMWDEIDAAFHVAGKAVIFAWGDTIFNPMGGPISPALMAHEAVHGKRQGPFVEDWWHDYIVSPEFRLAEEIPAHQAEYREFCRLNTQGNARNSRRLYLHHVASRLASPLYGRLVTYDAARKLIKEGAEHG